jgi:hypothetical protein
MLLKACLLLTTALLVGSPHQQEPDTLRIYEYAECYAQAMELAPWEAQIVLVRDSLLMRILARTRADPTRFNATVWFNLAALEQVNDEMVRRTVVHELAHILTAEARVLLMDIDSLRGDNAVERVVSRIDHWKLWQGMCP